MQGLLIQHGGLHPGQVASYTLPCMHGVCFLQQSQGNWAYVMYVCGQLLLCQPGEGWQCQAVEAIGSRPHVQVTSPVAVVCVLLDNLYSTQPGVSGCNSYT